MAKYTTSVRSICEVNAGLDASAGQASVAQIIESARPKIFNFSYPIYDEEYRSVLETKILRHYYMREIGMETVGLWKMYLETRLNEIMPYYNKLYQSELLVADLNPFWDVDYTKTGNKTGTKAGQEDGTFTGTRNDTNSGTIGDEGSVNETRDGERTTGDATTGTISDAGSGTTEGTRSTNTSGTETGTIKDERTMKNTRTDDLQEDFNSTVAELKKNDHWDYYSDTPQGSVGNLASLSYLTNARHITDDSNGTKTDTANTKTNVGTVKDSGSDDNTRTLNTATGQLATEESSGSSTTANTRTYDTNVAGTEATSETTLTSTANTRTTSSQAFQETSSETGKTTSASSTDEYLEHIVGRAGRRTTLEMLEQLRASYLNIDMLIIRDLNDLFFGLWE